MNSNLMNSRSSKHSKFKRRVQGLSLMQRRMLFHLFGFVLLVGTTVTSSFLLEGSMTLAGFSWEAAQSFFNANPMLFWISSAFILFVGLGLSLLAGSEYIGSVLNLICFGGIAFANIQKVAYRGEPIYPSDIGMIKRVSDLIEMINGWQVLGLGVGFIVLLLLLILLQRSLRHVLQLPKQGRKSYISRLVGLVPVLFVLTQFYFIGSKPTSAAQILTSSGYYNKIYNQVSNYETNGFVVGYLYNATATKMPKPAGYSENAVKRVVKKYAKLANKNNTNAQPWPKQLNVNVMLSESLTDLNYPDIQKYFHFSQNPTPFLSKMKASNNSHIRFGDFVSDQYGGGTGDVEYQVVTGMSDYFLNTSAYQTIVPKTTEYPSIAQRALKQGKITDALHSFRPQFYNRQINYPKLGIKTFLSISDLKHLVREPYGYQTTDQSLYDNVYSRWSENDRKHQGQFNLILTMQNHMPYYGTSNKTWLKQVQKKDPPIIVTGTSKLNKINPKLYDLKQLQNYTNSVRLSDRAFENLYAHIQQQKQPTIVAIFGDHRPGAVFDFLKHKDALQGHKTPVIYMANFNLNERGIGDISPSATVANMVDLANLKRSPWDQLILSLQSQVPVLTQQATRLSNGEKPTSKQLDQIKAYQDYRLINYDINFGKRYAMKTKLFD